MYVQICCDTCGRPIVREEVASDADWSDATNRARRNASKHSAIATTTSDGLETRTTIICKECRGIPERAEKVLEAQAAARAEALASVAAKTTKAQKKS